MYSNSIGGKKNRGKNGYQKKIEELREKAKEKTKQYLENENKWCFGLGCYENPEFTKGIDPDTLKKETKEFKKRMKKTYTIMTTGYKSYPPGAYPGKKGGGIRFEGLFWTEELAKKWINHPYVKPYLKKGGYHYSVKNWKEGTPRPGVPHQNWGHGGSYQNSGLIFNSPTIEANSELSYQLSSLMGGGAKKPTQRKKTTNRRTASRRLKTKNVGKRGGVTEIQSILFKKSKGWTKPKAEKWLKKHGKVIKKADVTKNYLRYRQKKPSKKKYQTFRTSQLVPSEGISVVYGIKR